VFRRGYILRDISEVTAAASAPAVLSQLDNRLSPCMVYCRCLYNQTRRHSVVQKFFC